jgi:hypothetical protein
MAYAHQSLSSIAISNPGNILVTPAGEPKLLDFGSRVLDSEADVDGPKPDPRS